MSAAFLVGLVYQGYFFRDTHLKHTAPLDPQALKHSPQNMDYNP